MIIDSFDNKTKSLIKLEDFYGKKKHILDICLVIFSKDIYNYILENYKCEIIGNIMACNGEYHIYKFNYDGLELGFYLSMIGSTMASQFVIESNHIIGASKYIMFGSCGSLDKEQTLGKYIVPTKAYRDEGMSYHYKEPCDFIEIKNCDKVKRIFDEIKVPYVLGKAWTTDAFLRETVGLIKKRKEEGCICVEMELSGVQAVCDFHGIELYNFLVSGDVLGEFEYDNNGLHNANHDLDKLFIAIEIAKRI